MAPSTNSRFSTALAVETYKLRRSRALLLATICPSLIAGFVFFHQLRLGKPASWDMMLTSSAAIWSFFMLPMSVTALTALMAHTEHGPRAWDHLRSLPRPRWHVHLAKAICVLGLLVAMSVLLATLTSLAVLGAGWWQPSVAATDSPDYARYLALLGRIFASSWLLVAVQLWVALRFSSFVPALALGIGGTFFAVVATSASIGLAMPWQIPVNQLAADLGRAQLALGIGFVGGVVVLVMMLFALSRREILD
ncbi:ABC transporter permease [Pseudoxanthomonas mexicana]|uniref:ABC transporter permease n=1 Tax=Pseudoxanthomonas mexicana TaxID=128785 RepID=UPI0022F39DC2|nr:ABC transporter permease [Pseudoxanthomonas mexicana]WBX94513.1 ABC transporter permease [Pseudoxanthomonas mexicana]